MSVRSLGTGQEVTRSLWLPVGRANFYSYTANGWLIRRDDGSATHESDAWSDLAENQSYVPRLQVSVLRRVLEVLPRSFGYESKGACLFADEDASSEDPSDRSAPAATVTPESASTHRSRPISVTMTLLPLRTPLTAADSPQWRANHKLVERGVPWVELTVDEKGFYVLSAPAGEHRDGVGEALDAHLAELFGGRFRIQWQLDIDPDPYALPSATRLAGLPPAVGAADYDSPVRVYNDQEQDGPGRRPLGILTFFQLNTLFEGLFNDALSPAVFFEQTSRLETFLSIRDAATPMPADRDDRDRDDPLASASPAAHHNRLLWFVEDVIGLIATTLDASKAEDQLVILRHFLAVTSRESLQKFKWSVESVRRALLDEMMGILHRQSGLVQVKLDRMGDREWSPELAQGANESQLRGYVMLAGAKLPIVANVHRFAAATAGTLLKPGLRETDAGRDLDYRIDEWRALLEALKENVAGLEKSVEHAWMERLLYEEEQSRAEQEAMAEIERTRASRLAGGGGVAAINPLGGTYNAVMLYFTIFAAVAAVATIDNLSVGKPLPDLVKDAWPIFALAGGLALFPFADRLWRRWKARLIGSDTFGYEFAFRLDQIVDTGAITKHLSRDPVHVKQLEQEDRSIAARQCPRLKNLRFARQGGARIEYSSADSTLVKLHLSVSFRTRRRRHALNPFGWLRRPARFEIINEFLVRRASGEQTFFLRETRVFGDAPRALDPDEVIGLLRFILERTALVFQAGRRKITADEVLRHAGMIFSAPATIPVGDVRSDRHRDEPPVDVGGNGGQATTPTAVSAKA